MRRSFEELVGQELDRLYRGALFLAGGREDRAERLLTAPVVEARRAYDESYHEPGWPELWLDRHLARSFLGMERFPVGGELDGGGTGFAQPRPGAPGTFAAGYVPASLGLAELAEAGTGLPPGHRVAFWLAMMERRKYGDIADILGRTREEVARWIREGYGFVQQALVVDRRRSARRGRRG